MSDQLFWKMMAEQDQQENVIKDINTLIKENPINWEEILLHSELMQSMRTKDPELLAFFSKPKIIESLLEFILKPESGKSSKIGMELFAFSDSPLLNTVITSIRISENLIKVIPKATYLNVGRITRIFSLGLTSKLETVTKLFTSSLTIIPILISKIQYRAVYELVLQYINIQQMKDKWIVWSLLKLLIATVQTPSIFNEFSDEVETFYKSLLQIKLEPKQKVNIVTLLYEFIKANQGFSEINTIISSVIHQLLMASNLPEFQSIVLKIASIIPSNDNVAIQCIEMIKKPNPITVATAEAFNYLADHPVKGLVTNFDIIANNAINDPSNTFHQIAFVKIVRSGMHPPLLRSKIIETMVPIITQIAKNDKWRSEVRSVGFLLDISIILDEYITDPTDAWLKFRANELAKWRSKDNVEILPEKSMAQNNPNFNMENIDMIQDKLPKQENNKTREPENSSAQNFPSFDEHAGADNLSFGTQVSQFPKFGESESEFPKFEKNEVEFPKFGDTEVAFPKFGEGDTKFPTFGESNESEFPKFGDAKPDFPKFETSNFPSFGEESEKIEFPKFGESTDEQITKFEETKSDFPIFEGNAFPAFSDANETQHVKNTEDTLAFDKPNFPVDEENTDFPKFGEGIEFPKFDDSNENTEFPKFGEKVEEFPKFENNINEDIKFEAEQITAQQSEENKSYEKEELAEENKNDETDLSVLYNKFVDFLHDECWDDQAPSATKLFTQEDPLADTSEAFKFLTR